MKVELDAMNLDAIINLLGAYENGISTGHIVVADEEYRRALLTSTKLIAICLTAEKYFAANPESEEVPDSTFGEDNVVPMMVPVAPIEA